MPEFHALKALGTADEKAGEIYFIYLCIIPRESG
jgi:hypothetical protein